MLSTGLRILALGDQPIGLRTRGLVVAGQENKGAITGQETRVVQTGVAATLRPPDGNLVLFCEHGVPLCFMHHLFVALAVRVQIYACSP